MEIYPAIDLRDGRVVSYSEQPRAPEPYSFDAVARAQEYQRAGASWVHVVDLDRALRTGRDNSRLVERIVQETDVLIQLGGGVAGPEELADAVRLGADRIVVGSAALEPGGTLERLASLHPPERLALSLDTRSGAIALRRTSHVLTITPEEAAGRAVECGIRTVIYRNLDRDGALVGADLNAAAELVAPDREIVLAGGLASIDEIRNARERGMAGVIIGRALHENRFTLEEALSCSKSA